MFDGPAAILDVGCTREDADQLAALWRSQVERMHKALGWPAPDYSRKDLVGGVSLAFTAAIDALYAASAINEWAYAACDAELRGQPQADFAAAVDTIRNEYDEERNARLLEWQDAALAKGVSFLWDDDHVSLGLGRSAEIWPARELAAIQ
jgi:hypothetical protein